MKSTNLSISRDVLKYDFKNRHCLHESTLYDVCLCSVIADVDFDGNKEIILGTYGEVNFSFFHSISSYPKFHN